MVDVEERSRILLIDSYDSFTNKYAISLSFLPLLITASLAALVFKAVPSAIIHIIKNDEMTFDELRHFLPFFSAVFVGPGPGSAANPSDVGVVKDLWKMDDEIVLPVFGVCLGLQSLGVEFGARLRRLDVVKHGYVSQTFHEGDELFQGISNNFSVVRYHSFCVDEVTTAPKLKVIAWTEDESDNGKVVMGLKHISKPFYAVQYHPESVCTDESGLLLIQNFWKLASQRNRDRKLLRWNEKTDLRFTSTWPSPRSHSEPRPTFEPQRVTTCTLSLPQLSITQICEVLGAYKTSTDFVLLDSAAHPGRHSVVGCIHSSTMRLVHYVGHDYISLYHGKRRRDCSLGSSDIWTWLGAFMHTKRATGGECDSPFWGGLIGYLSYEMGVNTLGLSTPHCASTLGHPDVNLVYVERSLVFDTTSGKIYLQSLVPKDDDWFAYTASMLKRAACGAEKPFHPLTPRNDLILKRVEVALPDKQRYIDKIEKAKEYLFSGDSYELCLTARTSIKIPKDDVSSSQSSWDLYKKVRSVNPAPYSAYLRLYRSTIISSSPERFLSYSRPPNQVLQLRPIKGTVRKGSGVTREVAEEILGSQKEIGENLMIVDLIRHDLHGVLGNNVNVKKFCGIEEYKTVWQLVSVIEGTNEEPTIDGNDGQLGWQALSKSLPPGSMTGAPKKRSVQILNSLEDDGRSIYSGVIGYWCVGGSGDWSVVIRNCYKLDADADAQSSSEKMPYDEWLVGAGGAITALSDPEAEWDEMIVKLQSVLRAFDSTLVL